MRVPSPDAALIAATDRALAIAQRRGVPLPALILPFCPIPAAASIALGLTMPGVGQPLFLLPWLMIGALFGYRGLGYARTLARDARSWDPPKAARYRADAVTERERRGDARGLVVMLAAIPVSVLAFAMSGHDVTWPVTANAAAYLAVDVSAALLLYARTALPHDPDLRARLPAPQAA